VDEYSRTSESKTEKENGRSYQSKQKGSGIMLDIHKLASHKVGDIVTLSDLQTQIEFNSLKVDFVIDAVRHYNEPSGVFKFTGYVVHADGKPDEPPYMILIKEVGNAHDVFVYYLDSNHEFYVAKDGQPPCEVMNFVLNDTRDNFRSRIECDVAYKEGSTHVVWDLQGTTFGVKYKESEGVYTGDFSDSIVTLGEFFTNSDNKGNSYCLMDWSGDIDPGFLEIWYGCVIKNHEIEIFSVRN